MAKYLRVMTGMILLALVLMVNVAGAADIPHADLNVSKTVSSSGPYAIDDEVTWAITLRNDGPANATSITLQEDISQLLGLKNITAEPGSGVYNTTTNVWSIDELKNATSATLTIKTNFTAAGVRTNRIILTGLNETDPVSGNNQAEAVVHFNISGSTLKDDTLTTKLVIKPTTLNLNSKGVFTVYVSLYGSSGKPRADDKTKARIDYASSSLTCSDAEMITASVSNKDGGTLITKFHRDDLETITSGDGVKIMCSGTLVVNGNTVNVEGSDTVRVIGEKKGLDKIFSRLWKFLGIEKDDVVITEDENGTVNLTISLDPEDFKKFSQIKKSQKTKENATETLNVTSIPEIQGVQEHSEKNYGPNKQVSKNYAAENKGKGNNNEDKGNHNAIDPNDDSSGMSKGKRK